MLIPRFTQIICSRMFPYFLYFLKHSGIIYGSKIQKSWIFEIWAFKIMISGFYCTNLEQINSRQLLNLLFKHVCPINDPQTARIIPISFPMNFLRLSYDFPHDFPSGIWQPFFWEDWCLHFQTQGDRSSDLQAAASVDWVSKRSLHPMFAAVSPRQAGAQNTANELGDFLFFVFFMYARGLLGFKIIPKWVMLTPGHIPILFGSFLALPECLPNLAPYTFYLSPKTLENIQDKITHL